MLAVKLYAAIEEALSNAVYHKGCDIREPIEVPILPDKIEIHSPSPSCGKELWIFIQYCAASALLSCNCSLSAIRAMNSLLVGFPLVLLTV